MVKTSYRLCDDDIIYLQRIMKIYIQFCITSIIWLVSLNLGILRFSLLLMTFNCEVVSKMVTLILCSLQLHFQSFNTIFKS